MCNCLLYVAKEHPLKFSFMIHMLGSIVYKEMKQKVKTLVWLVGKQQFWPYLIVNYRIFILFFVYFRVFWCPSLLLEPTVDNITEDKLSFVQGILFISFSCFFCTIGIFIKLRWIREYCGPVYALWMYKYSVPHPNLRVITSPRQISECGNWNVWK